MMTRIVCLANSYKEKGRCLAGIELSSKNEPILPKKWIRPVCKTEHGQVPTTFVTYITPLDIIQLDIGENVTNGYQSENYNFDESTLKIVGRFDKKNLPTLCRNTEPQLFGNAGKTVAPEEINQIKTSLILISTKKFELVEQTFADSERSRLRLRFEYNSNIYDLPITDPILLHDYKFDKSLLKSVNEIFLVVSLGILYEGFYYKLVATVLY